MKKQLTVVLLVTAMAYLNIFGNGFVIDDQYFIVEKMADPVSQQGVFRPVRSLLYTVYFQIFGTNNPAGYHLHSLLVHLAATGLVYLIVGALRATPLLSFIAALLFGLHPVHTEAITYMAASMEMTGIVFMLLAFYLYLKNKNVLSYLFAMLAFFTYEMTLTLPLLLLLYEKTLGRLGKMRKMGGIWVMGGVYLITRFAVGVGLARGEYLAYSPYHTFLTMIKMVVKYIWLLIWPVTLSHNHTVVPGFEAFMTAYSDQAAILRQSILDPEILGALGVIGAIGGIGWKMRGRNPLVTFGIGWFFISLLPVLYIFPQGTAIAEKYLYLASFGWIIGMIGGIREMGGKMRGKMGMIIIVGILLFYGGRTYLRNGDWKSPITLWEYETQIHPKSELAFYSLGVYYGQSGQKEKAIEAYKKALELKPQFWQAENNLRNLLK